ncbi:thioredoxin family protein [Ectothiorhodospiraceae bacterium 2226]|nr:thioredoxin family protein [Ectothiorhodospiraceae bacterium 2226]
MARCSSVWAGVMALALAGAVGTVQAEPPAGYPFVTYEEGVRQAQAEDKPIFLYFGREGCGWCDKTNKETFSDAALRERYTENYVLVYVDAESGRRLTLPTGERITEMELGVRLRVFATPVFAYLDSQGERLYSAPGFKTVEDFKDIDRYVRGGHYQHLSLTEFLAAEEAGTL